MLSPWTPLARSSPSGPVKLEHPNLPACSLLLARDGRSMAEQELEALRKQRLAELQAKHGDPGDAAQQEAKHREAEMRNSILAQVLDQSARARLSNLALVKPEKTKAVENYLIQMARYGQLSGKVSEQGLIEILEKVSQQTEKKTTVKVSFPQSTRQKKD